MTILTGFTMKCFFIGLFVTCMFIKGISSRDYLAEGYKQKDLDELERRRSQDWGCECFGIVKKTVFASTENRDPEGLTAALITVERLLDTSEDLKKGKISYTSAAEEMKIDYQTRKTMLTLVCKDEKTKTSERIPEDQKGFRVYILGLERLRKQHSALMIEALKNIVSKRCKPEYDLAPLVEFK